MVLLSWIGGSYGKMIYYGTLRRNIAPACSPKYPMYCEKKPLNPNYKDCPSKGSCPQDPPKRGDAPAYAPRSN